MTMWRDVGNVYAPPVVFVATILTALDGGDE